VCPSGLDAMAPGRGRESSHVPWPDATDCLTSGPRLNDDAGRGWVVVRGDELRGMIFFHSGDDSDFVAKKKARIISQRKSRR
jgi:hypothetical protein